MKYLVALITAFAILISSPNMAFGACSFGNVQKLPNGNFEFCRDYYFEITEDLQTLQLLTDENDHLKKAIKYKDLQISLYEKESKLLRDLNFRNLERLDKADSSSKFTGTLWFGMGVLATVAVTWAVRR